MRRPAAVAAASLAALAVFAGAGSTSIAQETKRKPEQGFRLVRFGSCDELLRRSKAHAKALMGASGLPRFPQELPRATSFHPGPRRPGIDYSTTNVQEEGIDEPDIVKTNGSVVFAARGSRVYAADVDGGPLAVLGTLRLGAEVNELLLRRNRLLVLSRRRHRAYWPTPGSPQRLPPYENAKTTLTEVDVRDPARMRVVSTLTLDGHFVTARLHGGIVRVVVSSAMPDRLQFGSNVEQNRAIVAASPLQHWLPGYELKGTNTRRGYLVQCRHVWRPRTFSGLGLLTVVTIDLEKGLEPVNTVGVLADSQIAYASNDSLYLATEPWSARPADWGARPRRGAGTTIHKLGIASRKRTRYRASGVVFGFLIDQWSLSEHRGILRVASTDTPLDLPDAQTQTVVTTLEERVGRLVQVGRIGNLGRGERLYAVRFMGETAYLVTFLQVDPLYTLDLSEPGRPQVVGRLMIPGYSAYLHPVGEDLLLGVGQEGNDSTETRGLQVSLFDVRDPRKPARLARKTIGRGWSDVEFDHHAFLYWPPARLAVVPMGTQAAAVRVSRASGVRFGARIDHPRGYAYMLRSFVAGNRLYTISQNGIEERSLRTLSRRAWVEFPPG